MCLWYKEAQEGRRNRHGVGARRDMVKKRQDLLQKTMESRPATVATI
jgi:hypothetical protein